MTIKDRLNKIFRKIFDDDSICVTEEMTAADIDDWDSLSHIHIIVATEKEFGLKFTTVEVTGMNNVGDMIALIERKSKK